MPFYIYNDPRMIEVEKLRARMSAIILKKGMNSEESIKISQKLDALLNQIQKRHHS